MKTEKTSNFTMSRWDSFKKLGFGISKKDTPLRLKEGSQPQVQAVTSWEPGGVVLERYIVDGKLGKGGIGDEKNLSNSYSF